MRQKWIVITLALSIAGAGAPAAASPDIVTRAAEVPLEVAAAPGGDEGSPTVAPAEGPAPAEGSASPATEGPAPAAATAAAPATLPTRVDPGSAPLQVAIGLGPTAAGSREELAIIGDLERTLAATSSPKVSVRRLRSGASEPRSICRQRRDDLVVVVDYLPERATPVLVPHDCSLDQALGIRAAEAAREPGLAQVLWGEHTDLVRRGAQERRPPLIAPRTRRFLIAGGAIVALGVALGFIIAATLRPETVVVTVSP